MKQISIAVAALVAASTLAMSVPANAAGCLRGAVAGGVIGHYAGRHGVLGAGVGCLYGHHQAVKREREELRGDRYR